MPSAADVTIRDGLRLFTPAAALIKVPESFYVRHPVEAQVALASVRDASDVLVRLLEGGHSVVARRLAGAFRRIGQGEPRSAGAKRSSGVVPPVVPAVRRGRSNRPGRTRGLPQ